MGIARVCALVLVGMLAACSRTPDEVQVRQAIAAAAEAAQALEPGAVTAVLADDFEGNAGQLDRRRLANMMRLQKIRGEKLTVLLGPVSVERRGQRLVASFALTLGGGGRLLPERLGVYQVQTAWRLEDGQWRCYTASWEGSRPR